jgi:hypothetical protein
MPNDENETKNNEMKNNSSEETGEFVSMEAIGLDPEAILSESVSTATPKSEVVADSDWKIANYADLEVLKPSKDLKVERIPVNYEKKIQLVLYVRQLTVLEHLKLMENFIKADRKTGTAKADLTGFYQVCWSKMVVRTEPPNVTWKMVKRWGRPFFKKIEHIFPKPTEDTETGGISKEDKGN